MKTEVPCIVSKLMVISLHPETKKPSVYYPLHRPLLSSRASPPLVSKFLPRVALVDVFNQQYPFRYRPPCPSSHDKVKRVPPR